jgi:AcrR family transcriptional regulator
MTRGRDRKGRPPKAEAGDTKSALQEAALRLFAESGYAGTSIRAIAREVGLSESVLYAHFANKRAIFDAVLAGLGPHSAVLVFERIDPALAEADPPQFVRVLVDQLMDAWSAPAARFLVSVMVRDGLVHDPKLRAAVMEATSHMAAQFARWMDSGHLSPELGEPQDLAYSLISPVVLARLHWLHGTATPEEIETARGLARHSTDLFIRTVFRGRS